MRTRDALPSGVCPRGLSRMQAAAYVGVGATTFDKMVAKGTMPKPKKAYGAAARWDIRALDQAFDMLPQCDGGTAAANDDDDWGKALGLP
ncbi:helix-turn-helix transcriptional regulator [Nitrospirillum bahiense]|uniref:AlpA family transcriptional regulator n=1 Tax=Nitrospirillum amazonense TaxID=28077 RepID=A0A560F1Z4_9PROT|nr:hypothetical protein [Nitrospirillum amazonense]TWB15631.1 hypothetical protein FBZ88_12984 [Nitrospirillum amazonense]